MTNRPQSDDAQPPRSVWRHLFSGWILAYLLPAIVIFGIREHFRQQEARRLEQERNDRIVEQLRNADPDEMGPAVRMLLGIEND
jgi:hypothetical protein